MYNDCTFRIRLITIAFKHHSVAFCRSTFLLVTVREIMFVRRELGMCHWYKLVLFVVNQNKIYLHKESTNNSHRKKAEDENFEKYNFRFELVT